MASAIPYSIPSTFRSARAKLWFGSKTNRMGLPANHLPYLDKGIGRRYILCRLVCIAN